MLAAAWTFVVWEWFADAPMAVFDAFVGYFQWLLDPVTWMEFAFQGVGFMIEAASKLLPESIEDEVQAAGEFIGSVPIQNLAKAVGYLVSPVVDPNVFFTSIAGYWVIWVVSLEVKLAFWIKGHLWSDAG